MANITAQEAIRAARDEHRTFDDARHTNATLLRFLSRYQQRLLGEIAQLKPDAIAEPYEIDVASYDFELGEGLPAAILIHGGTVHNVNSDIDPETLDIVGYSERLQRRAGPAAYINGSTLFLLGRATDWERYTRIDLSYFPGGGTLTALSDTLDLPKQSLDTCAAALAAFMAGRTTDEKIDVRKYEFAAAAAEKSYVDVMTERNRVIVHYPTTDW